MQSPDSEGATATGQFLLVRHSICEASGGHAATRGAISEDAALAQLVKRGGGRGILRDGKRLISTRMYTGWRTLWPGFAKIWSGRGLLWLLPPRQRPLILHIWSRLDLVLRRCFIGVIIVVVYASFAAYLGLGLVLGIPHAVFLALLTGILEMIPIVGPGASAVIAGLLRVSSDQRTSCTWNRSACPSGAHHLLLSGGRSAVRYSRG